MTLVWSAAVTVDTIRPLVARAATRPASLARLFAPYDVMSLAARLGCDPRTALWLLLCDRPSYDCWQRDLDELAHEFGLDEARLEALIWDATATEQAGERRLEAA